MEPQVPPIVAGRFGLEQRCFYRHHDLYHEEVPEIDLETAISRPDLGAGCAVRTFLLLGDQNAGKSTMLHSFCREGDPNFMQLSSLLPVLSSSFINTRLVPRSLLGASADPNQRLSAVRDEMPFMDTDIARGLVMLTLENFIFFCNEFGISLGPISAGDGADAVLPGGFHRDTRFVALQFVELGGDHLDRLLRFTASNCELAVVREAEVAGGGASAEDDAFWADIHEVLLGSLRLLKDTTRTVYFVNCAVLLPAGVLQSCALRAMLRKLRFLDGALGAARCAGAGGASAAGGEIIFCVSRARAAPPSLDAAAVWAAARAECIAYARDELGASAAAAAQRALPPSPSDDIAVWEVGDDGLDLSALEEVAGSDAARAWRVAEARAGPVLALVRGLLQSLVLPTLRTRLRLVGVHAVRNLADDVEAGCLDDSCANLCVPSIVRNVARLLQQGVSQGGPLPDEPDAGLAPHVAELVLRCMAGLRRIEAPSPEEPGTATVVGRWVTCSDLAEYLEELEAERAAVPLPEVAALRGWATATSALVESRICTSPAPGVTGLPAIRLELVSCGAGGHADELPVVVIAPAAVAAASHGAAADDGVVFVTSSSSRGACAARPSPPPSAAPEAVGLPLDREFFALLTSESAIQGAAAHVAAITASAVAASEAGGGGVPPRPRRLFRFSAPEIVVQLRAIHGRLCREVEDLAAQAAAWALSDPATSAPALPPGTLGRMLHAASDAWQAQVLLGSAEADQPSAADEPAAKRVRATGAGRANVERLASRLSAVALSEGGAGAGRAVGVRGAEVTLLEPTEAGAHSFRTPAMPSLRVRVEAL